MASSFLTGVKVNPPSIMSQMFEGYTSVLPDRELVIEHFKLIENGTTFYYFRTLRACYVSKEEFTLCRVIPKSRYQTAFSEYQKRISSTQAAGLQKYVQTSIYDFL